jgi:signal transduction histidine kinase
MLESEFLIYGRRASARHLQTAGAFAFLLALTCLAIYPVRLSPLPHSGTFIAVIDTMHFLFSAIVATIFMSLASVLRSRALIALGTGYAFIGPIAVAHALTYPEAFSPSGLLGANYDTVTWLYLTWHTALPLCIIAYVRLKSSPDAGRVPPGTISVCLVGAALAAVLVVWLATQGGSAMSRALELGPGQTSYLQYALMLLCVGAIVLLWRGLRSILDLYLMLTLWAWFLEAALLPGASRFSVGWYAGRMMGLVSGLFVLSMLLIEMSRLYAHTAMLVTAQKRERENRLMLGEAVGAFIAHELRQPLAAIGLNAFTARKLGARQNLEQGGDQGDERAGSELMGVLDDLMKDSRRAHDIIESTRALFAEEPGQKRSTDINQLIRDTLLMTSRELRRRGVKAETELDPHLPPIAVNRMQMQQVLLNLFFNAAEAMSGVTGRARILTIRSSRGDDGIVIRVDDTGPSIEAKDQERIFDPFFSTKEHGMGMGLSICRAVIHAHEGSIQVTSGAAWGASFEVALPYGVANAPPLGRARVPVVP